MFWGVLIIVRLIVVVIPFPGVARHVIEPQWIRWKGARRERECFSVSKAVFSFGQHIDARTSFAIMGGITEHLAASTGSIFPLGFSRQVNRLTRLLAEPLAEGLGIPPGGDGRYL